MNDHAARRSWLLLAALAFGLRFFLLSDMEYKGDEQHIVEYIASLGTRAFSPLTEVSDHSGLAHSSIYLYMLWVLSLGFFAPLWLASIVAGFNGLAIAWPLWLLRRDRAALMTYGFCAVSLTLVLASRKIWPPDLQAPWLMLGIGFWIHASRQASTRAQAAWTLAAGACMPIAGQMYLAGVLVPAVVTVTVGASLLAMKDYRRSGAWLAGCLIGWATFIPYAWALWASRIHSDGVAASSGARTFSFAGIEGVLARMATVPSPLGDYQVYLNAGMSALERMPGVPPILALVLALIVGLVGVWTLIFWFAILQVFRRWSDARRDPLVIASIVAVPANALAIQAMGLGNHLHYWFAVLPFAFYLMAWGVNRARSHGWRRIAWASIGLSAVCSLFFALLVHQAKGLPGEYGPSYSSQAQIVP